jgi:hypothetical protein
MGNDGIEKASKWIMTQRHPEIQTKTFKKNLLAAIYEFCSGDFDEYEPFCCPNIIPDGYTIDPESGLVTIYEIEDTNKIKESKMWKLADLWWELDVCAWRLRVFVTDRYFENMTEIDMHAYAYYYLCDRETA